MTNEKQAVLAKQFLLSDTEELRQAVSQLNSWNGSLEHLDVQANDEEFFNVHFEGKPMEAVRAAQYGEYNYTDEYVRFNGYGNLESFSDITYEQELNDSIDEIVETLLENWESIDLPDELQEIFES